MEKIIWTDLVRDEEVLHRAEEERIMFRTINRRKAKWIGHILRRNCFLQHDTERKIDVISEGKTTKKTLAATGWSYGRERILGIERGSTKLKEEALN